MLIFDFICSLAIPLTLIIIGLIFYNHAPKKINYIAGWRTKLAMRDQETWDFANRYGGKCFLYLGLSELIISLIIFFLINTSQGIKDILTLFIILLQCLLFIPCILNVEGKIKKKFY